MGFTLVFVCCGFVLAGFTAFSYQQLSSVELPFRNVLQNALLLIFAGKGRSFAATVFALLCTIVCIKFYLYAFFLALAGLYAVAVMTFSLIFLPVFRHLFPEGDDAP